MKWMIMLVHNVTKIGIGFRNKKARSKRASAKRKR